MAELDCARLHEMGPELALGVLAGRDRARAIAHLQACPACERHIRELTAVGDRLVSLAPGAEPPVGFEERVLTRLGLARRRRWRRRWIAAAAVVLGIGFAGTGWVLHDALQHDHDLAAAPLTAGDGQIGEVFAYADHRSWLYVDVSAPRVHGTITCQVRFADGRTLTVGSFPVTSGAAHWGGPAPLTGADLLEVRLLADDGSVLGTASFG